MSENRHNRGLLAGWIVCFFPFVVASTAIAQPPSPPRRAEGRPAQIEDPYRFTPTYSPKLSEASAEERSVRERAMQQEREAAPRPARAAQGARPRGPGRAPETKPGDPVISRPPGGPPGDVERIGLQSGLGEHGPAARPTLDGESIDPGFGAAVSPNDLVSFLGSAILPAGQSFSLSEPSGAQAGKNALVAGNWYLARSVDGGISWSFISPSAGMTDFCCDQEILFDRGRNMFLWYRQAVGDSAGRNRFVLSSSTDGGANWCSYSVRPSSLDSNWTVNQGFDYPRLALSNNYVYVVSGMNGRGVPGSVAIRLPLDGMASCQGLGSVLWWGQLSYWASPVQGATTKMYFGDHRGSPNSFRIYEQAENVSGIVWHDVTISSWLLEQGAVCPLNPSQNCCPSADGSQWCARSDSLVRAGWVANGVVGFMWNAKQGGGFPFPYVEAATFDTNKGFAYVGRPLLWNRAGAWHYSFVSPNARGDLGGVAFFSAPSSFPSPYFLVFDDYSPSPQPGWQAYRLFNGTAGSAGWGDYVRARAFQPSQLGWTASVYTMQPGGAEPLFYLLARERDLESLGNWFQK